MRAELDGLICSGARRGKQFTYTLLDERAPPTKSLEREEALAELARRYFMSRGPATVQDLAKWSGLTLGDARNGLEAIRAQLRREVVNGQSYWLSPATPSVQAVTPTAYLLSIYMGNLPADGKRISGEPSPSANPLRRRPSADRHLAVPLSPGIELHRAPRTVLR
jgi:hypothetical protein